MEWNEQSTEDGSEQLSLKQFTSRYWLCGDITRKKKRRGAGPIRRRSIEKFETFQVNIRRAFQTGHASNAHTARRQCTAKMILFGGRAPGVVLEYPQHDLVTVSTLTDDLFTVRYDQRTSEFVAARSGHFWITQMTERERTRVSRFVCFAHFSLFIPVPRARVPSNEIVLLSHS